MCRVISCVVEKVYLLWPVCSLDKSLLAFALLYFVLQRQICLLLWVSLNILFCIPIPYDAKDFVCGTLHSVGYILPFSQLFVKPPQTTTLPSYISFSVCVCVCVSSRRSYRSFWNQSTSDSSALVVGAWNWIAVTLIDLPRKQTKIILSLLRLHPNTAFQNLLSTARATPFFLRGSCPW